MTIEKLNGREIVRDPVSGRILKCKLSSVAAREMGAIKVSTYAAKRKKLYDMRGEIMAEDRDFYVMKDYEEHARKGKDQNLKGICPACKKEFVRQGINHKHCSECGAPYERNRFIIFKRDKFQCAYCGNKSYAGAELHVDHVHPKNDGGENKAYNLITSCKECNLSKNYAVLESALEQDILAEIARRNEREGINPETNVKNVDL